MISRDYLRILRSYQDDFGKNYYIHIDKYFDPRVWLRSKDVTAELVWPKDLLSQYNAFIRGDCSSLDFAFILYSPKSKTEEKYVLTIKYRPYASKRSNNSRLITFYPYKFSHSCKFCNFQLVSFGGIEIYCKHLYAALREADSLAKKYVSDGIVIAESMFYPRNQALFRELDVIERSKIPAEEKLKRVFDLIEREMYIEELRLLKRLNQRISHLKKV